MTAMTLDFTGGPARLDCPVDGCFWTGTATASYGTARVDDPLVRAHLQTHDVRDWMGTVLGLREQVRQLGGVVPPAAGPPPLPHLSRP